MGSPNNSRLDGRRESVQLWLPCCLAPSLNAGCWAGSVAALPAEQSSALPLSGGVRNSGLGSKGPKSEFQGRIHMKHLPGSRLIFTAALP